MPEDLPTDERPVRATEAADRRVQSAVLLSVLASHPAQLTLEELRCELSGGEAEFECSDAVERAVGDLAGAGLLNRHGRFVSATRAAVRFEEIADL